MRLNKRAICALSLSVISGIVAVQAQAPAPCPPLPRPAGRVGPSGAAASGPGGGAVRPAPTVGGFGQNAEMNKSTVLPTNSPLIGLPNPYREDFDWPKMPVGRVYGDTRAVAIDADGKSVWIVDRCDLTGSGCSKAENKNVNPIMHFDANGNLIKSFGAGTFAAPHGVFVDDQDHIWTTDGGGQDPTTCKPIGNTLREYTADGKMLMEIKGPVNGKPFTGLNDVVIDPKSGDIFLADGHGGGPGGEPANDRIMKFDKTGKFLMEWGQPGKGDSDISIPHGLAIDKEGRIYVADRSNGAVKVFDQNGKLLNVWKQFGPPSGVYVRNEWLYVADETANNPKTNPDLSPGIRIAKVSDGKILYNIPYVPGNALEGVSVDAAGNVYGANTNQPRAVRWLKVQAP